MEINTSTLENPIAFIEHILLGDGIAILRKEFVPTTEDEEYYGSYLSFDVNTEEKEHRIYDPIIDDQVIQKSNFRDFLYLRCNYELDISIKLFDNKILEFENTDRIDEYLKIVFIRLEYLRSYLSQNSEVKKYPLLKEYPDSIEQILSKKYNLFIKNSRKNETSESLNTTIQFVNEQINFQKNTINKKPYTSPGVFKWTNGDTANLSEQLFNFLTANKMIDTKLDTFSKAFSGMHIDKPLKIKWIDSAKNKSTVNKVTLLYMFKLLSDSGLITAKFGTRDMFKKLSFVFVDNNGNEIRNLTQSKININKAKTKTKSKELLEDFIYTICNK